MRRIVVYLGVLLHWLQLGLVLILRRGLDERRKDLGRRFVGLLRNLGNEVVVKRISTRERRSILGVYVRKD